MYNAFENMLWNLLTFIIVRDVVKTQVCAKHSGWVWNLLSLMIVHLNGSLMQDWVFRLGIRRIWKYTLNFSKFYHCTGCCQNASLCKAQVWNLLLDDRSFEGCLVWKFLWLRSYEPTVLCSAGSLSRGDRTMIHNREIR